MALHDDAHAREDVGAIAQRIRPRTEVERDAVAVVDAQRRPQLTGEAAGREAGVAIELIAEVAGLRGELVDVGELGRTPLGHRVEGVPRAHATVHVQLEHVGGHAIRRQDRVHLLARPRAPAGRTRAAGVLEDAEHTCAGGRTYGCGRTQEGSSSHLAGHVEPWVARAGRDGRQPDAMRSK
ncbi:MAG: hypothetical protein IPN32_32455 [Deltaproteobacteria bacterium]|nr:hypothetical protein [Deltaproteobacteria bacterium]